MKQSMIILSALCGCLLGVPVLVGCKAVPGTSSLGGVQLWEGGPYWAECNVGATRPEEPGYYFGWGDTVGYKREGGTWTDDCYYADVTWMSSSGERRSSSPFEVSDSATYGKDTVALRSLGYIDATGNLVAAHDAATVYLGGPWRMPTAAEFDELVDKCTTVWSRRKGVRGYLVTGKGRYASHSIFLPAAGQGYGSWLDNPDWLGFYWASTADSDGSPVYSGHLFFNWHVFSRMGYIRRSGQSVRPVRNAD